MIQSPYVEAKGRETRSISSPKSDQNSHPTKALVWRRARIGDQTFSFAVHFFRYLEVLESWNDWHPPCAADSLELGYRVLSHSVIAVINEESGVLTYKSWGLDLLRTRGTEIISVVHSA